MSKHYCETYLTRLKGCRLFASGWLSSGTQSLYFINLIFEASVQIKAKSSGFEIIYSATFHLTSGSLELVYEGISLDVVFIDDDGDTRYETGVSGTRMKLSLFNFNNPLGEGRIDPIPFATTGGLDVKLTFWAHNVDKAQNFRILTLTLMKALA